MSGSTTIPHPRRVSMIDSRERVGVPALFRMRRIRKQGLALRKRVPDGAASTAVLRRCVAGVDMATQSQRRIRCAHTSKRRASLLLPSATSLVTRAANIRCRRRRHDDSSPRKAARRVHQRVENRPIRDHVACRFHRFRLSRFGRGNAAAVQMNRTRHESVLSLFRSHKFVNMNPP